MREIDLDMAFAAELPRSQRQSQPLAGDSRDRWMREFDKAASPAGDAKQKPADGRRSPAQASRGAGQTRAAPRLAPLIFALDSAPAAEVSDLNGRAPFEAAAEAFAPSVSPARVQAQDIGAAPSVAAPDVTDGIAAPDSEAMAPTGELLRTAGSAELTPEGEDTPAPAPAVKKLSGRRLPAMPVPSCGPAATGVVEAAEDAGLRPASPAMHAAAARYGAAPPPALNPELRAIAARAAEPSAADSPVQEPALRELAPAPADASERLPAGFDRGEPVRYFSQSTHFYVDTTGVHAWIRDTRLAPERALAVIRTMAVELAVSGKTLAGVTVNGKPQALCGPDESGERERSGGFATHLAPGALREIAFKRDSRDNRDNGGN